MIIFVIAVTLIYMQKQQWRLNSLSSSFFFKNKTKPFAPGNSASHKTRSQGNQQKEEEEINKSSNAPHACILSGYACILSG